MKYNKLTAFASLAFAMMGLTACTDSVDYEAAEMPANAQVYFSETASTDFQLAENQDKVSVNIYRQNTSGSIEVALAYQATADGEATDIFSVPAAVTFPDGSNEAVVDVFFDFSNIVPNTQYAVTLKIVGDERSPYGPGEQTLTLAYSPWSEWERMDGEGVYTSNFLTGADEVTSVYTRRSLLNDYQVQYLIPGGKNSFTYGDDMLLEVNLTDNSVSVPVFQTGYVDSDEYIYGADSEYFWTVMIPRPEYAEPSTFDPERGLFTLSITYYTPNAGAWLPTTEYLQLPGFADLNIYFANAGQYIDENNQEYAVVNITKSDDVASFAYRFVQGYLGDAAIAKIVAEMEADENPKLETASGTFKFPVNESDYYTIVTVGYDQSGEPVCSNSFSFNCELTQVDWNEGWTSLGEALYTDAFLSPYYFYDTYSWAVEVQESQKTPGLYRLVKPYAAAPFAEDMEIDRGHFYVYIDATNPNDVWVEPSLTSTGWYIASLGAGTMTDGKITFSGADTAIFMGYDDNGEQVWYSYCEDESVVVLDLTPEQSGEDLTESITRFSAPAKTRTVKSPAQMSARFGGDAGVKFMRSRRVAE